MKRKRAAKADTIAPEPVSAPQNGGEIDPEIMAEAHRSIAPLRAKPAAAKCVVCGSECVAGSAEQLCWVCRRLKISAWRESEQQQAVQE